MPIPYTLPVELWCAVILFASPDTQRSFLWLSRYFHRLAVSVIFRRLVFRYGTPGYDVVTTPRDGYYGHVRQFYRNESVLRHIAECPEFASAVREIFFCWYDGMFSTHLYERHLGGFATSPNPFAAHTLRRADIRRTTVNTAVTVAVVGSKDVHSLSGHVPGVGLALPRTTFPTRPVSVLAGLFPSDTCRTDQNERYNLVAPSIACLRNLERVFVCYGPWPRYDGHRLTPPVASLPTYQLIEGNASSLVHLELCGDAVWSSQLPKLRALMLTDVQSAPSLPSVLYLDQLTSLRLCVLKEGIAELLDTLSRAASTCPRLQEFKLICDGVAPVGSGAMGPVAAFVRNKVELVRLHVVFYVPDRVDDGPLVDALRGLRSLRVLGFEITPDPLTEDHIRRYDEALPDGLTDILVYSEVEHLFGSRVALSEMVRVACLAANNAKL